MAPTSANLPVDDTSDAIKFSYPVIAFFSTFFVVLRICHNVKVKKHGYIVASDWLLALAQAFALTGTTFGYVSAWFGAGKHTWDPSVTKDDIGKYLKYLWFGQYFNLTAMAALKFSICAFMLQLNFSKTFQTLIWVTVAAHIGLNIVFPYVILFGECRPVAKHWDATLFGSCWSTKPRTFSGYLAAGSNIASDVLYTCAPLIYTRKVQLPRRALWGVRVVFLLGLIATAISAVKLYQIRALSETADFPYKSVNLSILSVTEVFVGTLTASLPPLRRLFEGLLNRLVPESAGTTRRRSYINNFVLSPSNTRNRAELRRDDSSERTILARTPGDAVPGGITKTTDLHMIVVDATLNGDAQPKPWS